MKVQPTAAEQLKMLIVRIGADEAQRLIMWINARAAALRIDGGAALTYCGRPGVDERALCADCEDPRCCARMGCCCDRASALG